jgi:pyrroline-5-carboxylate reductase
MAHPFLAVIGGGNMGKAIITGGVHARILSPSRVCVAEHDAARRSRIAASGVTVFASANHAMHWLSKQAPSPEEGQVLLAIKPQSLAETCAECEAAGGVSGRVLISILAGTPIATLAERFAGSLVVRAMPNLPAAIGQGATAICLGTGVADANARFAESIFKGVGPLVLRIDESLMDAFTALAGSGPAYVFYLAEAMIAAGIAMGFTQEQASAITRATIAGSGDLLAQSSDSPEQLRSAVTSKGGTTQAATTVLDEKEVRADLIAAILAARDRGAELSK